MGALAGDSPCLAPWRWHRAHLHREEAGLDIPCHGSQPEGSLGHRHHLCLRLGERKTKESPALSSSTYTKHGERENGRINDHSSGSLLHTHMHGVPTLGCLGCSEKQSMCCSIIPGTGRWARRCWSRPGPQSTAQPFSKAPTLSPLFYKQRQQHSPGVGSALPLRCPGAGPQLASPVTVPLRHLLAAAFAFPTLQQLLQ